MADHQDVDERDAHVYGPEFASHLHYDKPPDGGLREVPPAADPNSITFKQQRRVHPIFWFIITIICVLAFLIGLLCFYVAPSSRQIRLETHVILNEIYREAYADMSSTEYRTLTENIISSFQVALNGINYDRVKMDDKHNHGNPLRNDSLGLHAVVDVFVTIDDPPVTAGERRKEIIETMRYTLPDSLQTTFLGSLGILEIWIAVNKPPEVKLECSNLQVSTDIALSTATVDLPNDAMPKVPEINGETPRVWRVFYYNTEPTDQFPLGTTEAHYLVIYSNIANSGATAECTFEVEVKDTENPSLTCPTQYTTSGNSVTWNEPVISDNVSDISKITSASTHNSGDTFTAADTVVTYYARDEAGNTGSCTFTISI